MKIESPIYRFEKFDKNWLFVKISDLASQFKTGGTPSTKEPTFWGGSIPWIQSSDIQKDILFGVIPQKFISEEGLQNSSAKLIPKNSIAIVTRVGVWTNFIKNMLSTLSVAYKITRIVFGFSKICIQRINFMSVRQFC